MASEPKFKKNVKYSVKFFLKATVTFSVNY